MRFSWSFEIIHVVQGNVIEDGINVNNIKENGVNRVVVINVNIEKDMKL